MPSVDREDSRDRELVLKHQLSVSDSGRSSVPMWDSSDPDRAPPPLPLNPGSSSPATKPNTSGNIAAAAEALTARARESAYVTNPPPPRSPEKSLIKGQYHKRMQSFQNGGSLRDRNSYFENAGTLGSPERLSRPSILDSESRSTDRSPTRSGTPAASVGDLGRETPSLRRPPPKAILGENTPPSATMLALQNMPTPKEMDTPLANMTSGSRPPQGYDAISNQILSLTTIATNLQREMAQLSRRSKDNATDLVSLKEATNSRDEDIRKSLRDLVINLSSQKFDLGQDSGSQATSSYGRTSNLFIDSKAHISPPSMSKSFSLPRIPSPTSFGAAMERDLSSTPYNSDGAASIALLEKVLREMGTKEGQERVMASLTDLLERPKVMESDPAIVKKLEDIIRMLREKDGSMALVRHQEKNSKQDGPPQLVLDFEDPRHLARVSREPTPNAVQSHKAVNFITEDMQKLLQKMGSSIKDGGGMTAEIKALVRELRGEVLGMGREIGRKLDQAESSRGQKSRGDVQGPGREEIAMIVREGLDELRSHMEEIMREKRRQSSSSTVSRNTVDSQEVYAAVRNALSEIPFQQFALQNQDPGIRREEILDAVREAWETNKPEIELQNFGLERDEILQCLKEGLQEYRPAEQSKEIGGASYEEVLDAVREGLQHFKPPPVENAAAVTREEILETVRECLDSFEFPSSSVGPTRETEITREDVLDAVKEGLSAQQPEIEINRDDLFQAVRAGLEGAPTPMNGVGEQVLEKMEDLIDGMRSEFKQYSAANGGDTEQVLDALKDGLEVLRANIETYVDRAADVTGKDEIIDTVRDGLEHLRIDLEGSITNAPRGSDQANNNVLLDAMEKEFEHLRQTIATSMLRSGDNSSDKDEILDAIRDEVGELKDTVRQNARSANSDEALHAMREKFEHLRGSLATTMVHGGVSAEKEEMLEAIREGFDNIRGEVERRQDRPESIISNTSELIDALNDGLDLLRADLEKVVNKPLELDMSIMFEIRDTLKEGLINVRSDIDRLLVVGMEDGGFSSRRGGEVVVADGEGEHTQNSQQIAIERMQTTLTQLMIKVEAMDNMPPPPPSSHPEGAALKVDLEDIETSLREIQSSLAELAVREHVQMDGTATKDDTEAIETLLRNLKASIDENFSPESDGLAKGTHVESLEAIVLEARDAIHDLGTRFENETTSKEDLGLIEALLKEVRAGLDEMRDRPAPSDDGEKVGKTDIEALELLCMDIKTQLSGLVLPDFDTLPSKIDVEAVGVVVRDFTARVEEEAELTAQAFEARKIEHGGIADKIEDVKGFLDHIREELKSKIHDSHGSLEELAKTFENITETIVSIDATASIQDLKESVAREFERIHGSSEDLKAEADNKHVYLLEKHGEYKDAIVADLVSKIDGRFDELMIKYDDAQLAAEEKERALGAKDLEQTNALHATKAVAEDLRLLMDTLGSTMTESCDHLGEDSKTVFLRVEEISTKLDNLLTIDTSSEHQSTRAEVSKVLTDVEGIQAHVSEYHPKILEAVKDVLSIVGQHYEQAKASTEEIKTSVREIPSAIPLPALPAAPLLSPPAPIEMPVIEKYDDSELHAKIDRLIQNAADAPKVDSQISMLEQIREQVAAQAVEFSAFVAGQHARITESNDSLAKEAEEVAIALEKRTAQRENVEADIVRLSEEKAALSKNVQELLEDKDELVTQKSKLQADLSSLQMALQIRREELEIMEVRADGLERRILDGVLDHSRSLLVASRPPSSLKAMDLKRVISTASNATTATRASTIATTIPSAAASAVSSGIGIALKRRQPPKSKTGSTSSNKNDRRILSLSTLGVNKGPSLERSIVLADPARGGGASNGNGFGVKRSHSVKSNFPVRKSSWGGTKAIGMYGDDTVDEQDNKENSILDEEDEDFDAEGSEAGTERRTSYTGTYTGTSMSYGDGSVVSADDRRTSYATSTVGTIGTREEGLAEDEDLDAQSGSEQSEEGEHREDRVYEHHEHREMMAAKGEVSNAGEMVVFGAPSDSGIGTDIPTAAIEGGSDYFQN